MRKSHSNSLSLSTDPEDKWYIQSGGYSYNSREGQRAYSENTGQGQRAYCEHIEKGQGSYRENNLKRGTIGHTEPTMNIPEKGSRTLRWNKDTLCVIPTSPTEPLSGLLRTQRGLRRMHISPLQTQWKTKSQMALPNATMA